jgi:hypothetical protein
LPAPPESATSVYFSTRNGKLISKRRR